MKIYQQVVSDISGSILEIIGNGIAGGGFLGGLIALVYLVGAMAGGYE